MAANRPPAVNLKKRAKSATRIADKGPALAPAVGC